MFSWIQHHILVELTRHTVRRYSQLRPREVEGNLFMYHLKGLIQKGLVEKGEREYRLTAKGLQFVSTLSLKTGRFRKQPQILVAIAAKNTKGEYLWSRWRRQPNMGLISFPHGMLHYGEGLLQAAARELAEKTGMQADLSYRGDVYIRGVLAGEIDRHMLVHIFEAAAVRPGREAEYRSDVSEPFWATLSEVESSQYLPGFYQIAQLVDTNSKGCLFDDIQIKIESNAPNL